MVSYTALAFVKKLIIEMILFLRKRQGGNTSIIGCIQYFTPCLKHSIRKYALIEIRDALFCPKNISHIIWKFDVFV